MSGDSAGADPGRPAPARRGSGHGGARQDATEPADAGTVASAADAGTDAGAAGSAAAGSGAADASAAGGGAGGSGAADASAAGGGTGDAGAGDAGMGARAADAEALDPAQARSWRVAAARTGKAGWDVPWAESPVTGAGAPGRAELEVAFATAMRRTGSLMQLMSQAAADRIGINATDLNCLNILSFGGHMTAGELARATGLTTASITGVVDRLEEAGFVSRERDPHDRRRVVVTLSLERAMHDVASVFQPVLRDWRTLAARYSDDELRLIVDFYARMEQVFRDHLVRLRTEERDG
jgi:DNA-binding MarR family transcriptional regulator